MKTMIITLSSLLLILIIFQSFMAISTSKTEKQAYQVIKKEDDFEIRYYPPATFATIQSSAKSYRELGSSGFRKIAGYIFGNNETSSKIAMTSPVHMDITNEGSSMSFVMPSEYDIDNLPRPNDASVKLHKTPGEYAAAISFGGFANDASINKYAAQLERSLQEKGIKTTGHFRYLGYNPPYQLVGRKNEVIVAVEWKVTK
ncbi:MAG: SOUL family heme-binding protein [bacterium]